MSDAEFLREAARYFRKRPTAGADMAFWANIYNAENCERIANRLEVIDSTDINPGHGESPGPAPQPWNWRMT